MCCQQTKYHESDGNQKLNENGEVILWNMVWMHTLPLFGPANIIQNLRIPEFLRHELPEMEALKQCLEDPVEFIALQKKK